MSEFNRQESVKSRLSERGVLVLKAAQKLFLQHGYDAHVAGNVDQRIWWFTSHYLQ